ncbi:MAG: hypothetical protein IKL10_04845 [Clostridia bacterium]|nr:hypothetical protein [Clostridia bacterium]
MKALTACLCCNKQKDCAESVQAHSFIDSCFEASDESIRAAIKDLQMLSRITLPVEVTTKTNDIIELLVDQSQKLKKLAHYIAEENCEKYCKKSNIWCRDEENCTSCKKPCGCINCEDMSNFELDWGAVYET